MMRRAQLGPVPLIGLLVGVSTLGAKATPPGSIPITSVRYDVTVDSAGSMMDKLKVEMTFSVATSGSVVLGLPAWAPGDYELKWFARRVSEFGATEDGRALAWNKVDPQTWSIAVPRAGRVRVALRYLGDSLDYAAQYTHSGDFATFDGVGFFMYPVGQGFNWPATVVIRAGSSAHVLTGLERGSERDSYKASSYHELVDAPFFAGQFDVDSVTTAKVRMRLGSYPGKNGFSQEQRTNTLQLFSKLLPVESAIFGEIPFRDYVVLQRSDPTGDNRGGLEHHNSQLVDLPEGKDWEGWHRFLYAHELFHAWNVKRLRPAALTPYRYDFIQPTEWLWVSEGITSYYANVSLVRAGLNDPAAFYGVIASDIQQIRNTPPFAVTDASLSEWVRPVQGTSGDYYAKGEVLGFLLDILVRDGSANRHSLDDVMRELYRSTYKDGSRGFTASDWWGTMTRLGGRSFEDFNRRYVTGREELPVASVLALAGLALVNPKQPEITISGERNGDCLRITGVPSGSAVEESGLRPGDCLIEAGGIPVISEYSLREVRARNADTDLSHIPLKVRRGADLLNLALPVRLVESSDLSIKVIDGASAKARSIREGIRTSRQ